MAVRGIPRTVLVAPDSFKGTFPATEVTEAISRGLESARRAVDRCPVANGARERWPRCCQRSGASW